MLSLGLNAPGLCSKDLAVFQEVLIVHFIRAFPLILVFVLVFGLTFAFADSSWITGAQPVLVSDRTYLFNNNDTYYYSNTGDSPVYAYGFSQNGSNLSSFVLISNYPSQVSYYYQNTSRVININQSIVVNGTRYYYSTTSTADVTTISLPVLQSDSLAESINFAFSSSNVQSQGILYNITVFVRGSLSWLTSTVTAVVSQPMLLFFVLIGFAGIFIGLLDRFRRFS